MPKKFYFLPITLLLLIISVVWTFNFNSHESGPGPFLGLDDRFLDKEWTEPGRGNRKLEEIAAIKAPLASTETFPVENADMTAVFIPQTHLNPGTGYQDPENDSAEIAQKQIYQIAKQLIEEQQIGFMMIEGEQYGPVAGNKADTVAGLVEISGKMEQALAELGSALKSEGYGPERVNGATGAIQDLRREINRKIYLNGAPYKLMAENSQILVYGSENQDTYAQCSQVVRDYIYQKDQYAKCAPTGGSALTLSPSGLKNAIREKLEALKGGRLSLASSSSIIMKKMLSEKPAKLDRLMSIDSLGGAQNFLGLDAATLKKYLDGRDISMELESLKRLSREKNSQKMAAAVGRIEDCVAQYNELNENTPALSGQGAGAPERNNNPYSHITDPEKLESMIEESEDKIQELVIDRRNEETAENFARALEETGHKAGILQYGAGHEEGLVKELNKHGITVIVLRPEEVANRNN